MPDNTAIDLLPADIIAYGVESGADAPKIATALQKWRDDVVDWSSGNVGDPDKWWRGTQKLDLDTTAELEKLQSQHVLSSVEKAIPDQRQRETFAYELQASGFDPDILPEEFKPAVDAYKAAQSDQSFRPPQRRYNAKIQDDGGRTLAAFDMVDSGEGDKSVGAKLKFADGTSEQINIPNATAEDAKKEAEKLLAAAKSNEEEAAKLLEMSKVSAPDSIQGMQIMAEQLRARAFDTKQKAAFLQKNGRVGLLSNRVKEMLNDPARVGKVGQGLAAGVGGEFAKGLASASIDLGVLNQRIQGDEEELKKLVAAKDELGTAIEGVSRPQGLLGRGVKVGATATGSMAPFLGGAFAARGLSSAAGRAAMDTGRLGVIGAGMGAESAGAAYGEAESLAQQAEKAGDMERADRIRAGRDLYAITQTINEMATERIGRLNTLRTSGRGLKSLGKDIIQEGAVEEGVAGLVQGGGTRPLALGVSADVSDVPEQMIGGMVAAGPLAAASQMQFLQNGYNGGTSTQPPPPSAPAQQEAPFVPPTPPAPSVEGSESPGIQPAPVVPPPAPLVVATANASAIANTINPGAAPIIAKAAAIAASVKPVAPSISPEAIAPPVPEPATITPNEVTPIPAAIEEAPAVESVEPPTSRRGGASLPPLVKKLTGPTGSKTQEHILSRLSRLPIPLPKEAARKGKGEWDWLGSGKNYSVPFNWRRLIFQPAPNTSDTFADIIGPLKEEGYFPGIADPTHEDLGRLIQAGIAEYDAARASAINPSMTREEREEQANIEDAGNFANTLTTPADGREYYHIGEGKVGDTFQVDGVPVTVTDMGEEGTVTLRSNNGVIVRVNEAQGEYVYADTPNSESSGKFLSAEDLKPDKPVAPKADMFDGRPDAPFNLVGETAEERKASEAEEDRVAKRKADEDKERARIEAEKAQTTFDLDEGDDANVATTGGAPLTPRSSPSPPIQPVKAISEIIRDLAKGLELPIRFGRLTTKKSGGYFNKLRNLIAVRKANDIPVVAHEVGHKLDALFDISRTPTLRTELDHLGDPSRPDSGSSWTPSKSLKYKYGEGIGEFVRYWLTDPAEATRLAPQTEAYFEAIMDANPDFGDVMRQAQNDIQLWLYAPVEARLDSSISVGSNPNKTRYGVTQLTRDLVDDLHILRMAVDDVKTISGKGLPADQNPYILARLLRGSYGMADTFIQHGVVDFNTREVTPGTSLQDALKPVAGEIDAFRRWIVSKRAQELESQGRETGLQKGDVDFVVNKYSGNTTFQTAFAKVKAWQDALLKYAVDAGYVTPEGAAAMRAMNQDYVPFHRVFEVGAGETSSQQGEGGRGLNVGKIGSMRRLKGSARDIVDPLESMLKNAYALITAAEKANINHAIGKLADKKGMGKWVEKIATPKEGVRIPLEKIRDQLEAAGADLTGVPDDLLMQMYRPAGKAPFGENIIRVVGRDGKPEFYRLNGDLFDSFHALDMEESSKLLDIAGKPANLLRAGVTLDPAFALANFLRDSFGSAVINRYGLLPFQAGIEGAAAMIGDPKLAAEFAASGGSNSIEVNFFDREAMSKFMREKITKQFTKAEQASIILKSPLTALRQVSGASETATRIGEYKKAVNALVKSGMPIGEARRQAAFEARDRQDFAKGGAKTKPLRRIAAFWNAGLQGNVRLYQSFKERPVRTTIQAMMYITLPTVALMALNYEDEDYWDKPWWERDAFWLIPYGKDENKRTKFIRIPKPFILGLVFGALPERMMAFHRTKDKKAFDGYMRTVAADLVPNPIPQVAQLLVADVLTGKQGWDIWRGREVVPDTIADLPAEQQWTEQTSLTARKIGELLGQSPMKVDHIIQGTTGGLGRLLTHQAIDRAIEAGTGEKRSAANTYLGSRFFAVPAGISSRAVEDFYKELGELREQEAGARAKQKLPSGTRLDVSQRNQLGAKFGYDNPRLERMEKVSKAMTRLRNFARQMEDPTKKQAVYLQIRNLAEQAQEKPTK